MSKAEFTTPYAQAHIYCAENMVKENFQIDASTPPWLKKLSQQLKESPEKALTPEDVAVALKEG